jgi:muramoyltetrapeptide carboxypeptidase
MRRRTFGKILGSLTATNALIMPSLAINHNITMAKATIKPARLKKGDLIQLVTPASPCSEEKIEKAITNIEGMGFKVKYSEAIRLRYGHLAGTDAQRLADFHNAFADKQVKAVWCVRGGYGCTRILPHLNYALIKANPKVLIGYSDITALLNAIYQRTGLVGFHGPVGATPFTEYNVEHINSVLIDAVSPHKIGLSQKNLEKEDSSYQPYIIRGGRAVGQLVGGNLCLLATMAGTPFQVDFKNRLVFLEDVGEKPYRIDRMITQLLQSSNLHLAKGIILGIFEDCQPKNEEFSLSLIDTLKERLGSLNIPVLYGFSFGHIQNMCIFPVGIEASLDADKMEVYLREKSVV